MGTVAHWTTQSSYKCGINMTWNKRLVASSWTHDCGLTLWLLSLQATTAIFLFSHHILEKRDRQYQEVSLDSPLPYLININNFQGMYWMSTYIIYGLWETLRDNLEYTAIVKEKGDRRDWTIRASTSAVAMKTKDCDNTEIRMILFGRNYFSGFTHTNWHLKWKEW